MRYLVVVLVVLLASQADAMSARSYIALDSDGIELISNNADIPRSIASITKLITADRSSKLSETDKIKILPSDIKAGRMRNTPLKIGQLYTRGELMELTLISSDNVAAIALGRSITDLTPFDSIVESSGLDPNNKLTAREVATFASTLYASRIAEFSTRELSTIGRRHSTNPLINKFGWEFFLSKTGFINQSGGCLVVILTIGNRPVTIVVLGSKDTRSRWRDLVEIRKMLGDTGFFEPPKSIEKKSK